MARAPIPRFLVFPLPAPAWLHGHSGTGSILHQAMERTGEDRSRLAELVPPLAARVLFPAVTLVSASPAREISSGRREVSTVGLNWKYLNLCWIPVALCAVTATWSFLPRNKPARLADPTVPTASKPSRLSQTVTCSGCLSLLPSSPHRSPESSRFSCREVLAKCSRAPLVCRTCPAQPAMLPPQLCLGNSSAEAAPCSNNLLWFPARGELSNCNT